MDVPTTFPSALGWDALPALFPGLPDASRWLPLLQQHASLIEAAEHRVRVTAVRPEDAIRRQYAESLEVADLARTLSAGGPAIDVGSGGGYPGMVLAIVMPAWQVHLVEPLRKRAALLEEMAAALGLANVQVHAMRAEEAGHGPLRELAPIVTARAVAEVRELLEYTAPLAAPGGHILLPKGSRAGDELAAAALALRELGCTVESQRAMRDGISDAARILVLRKGGNVAAKYPRRPGVPGKRPL